MKVATEIEQHQNWTVLQGLWFQPQEHLLLLAPESTRADRIYLESSNKAVMKGDLNSILSNRRKDKAKEAFQALKGRTTSIPS